MLADALAAFRRRIAKNKKLNDNNTKATLREPMQTSLICGLLAPSGSPGCLYPWQHLIP